MTQDLLFCWVCDKDKHLLWLSVGGTWTSFKAESSKLIGREITDRLDDVSEHLDGDLGQIRHGLHVLQSAIAL